jgi:hypothetical protein
MDISKDINDKSDQLNEIVNQFNQKNGSIISKLETMKTELSGHQSRCNASKTLSTSVSDFCSIMKVISLVFMPFT